MIKSQPLLTFLLLNEILYQCSYQDIEIERNMWITLPLLSCYWIWYPHCYCYCLYCYHGYYTCVLILFLWVASNYKIFYWARNSNWQGEIMNKVLKLQNYVTTNNLFSINPWKLISTKIKMNLRCEDYYMKKVPYHQLRILKLYKSYVPYNGQNGTCLNKSNGKDK